MPNTKLLIIAPGFFLMVVGLFLSTKLCAQRNEELNEHDLLQKLPTANDTTKADILRELAEYNIGLNTDSSLLLARNALELSEKIKYDHGKISSLFTMGKIFVYTGNYSRGLELYLQSLTLSEDIKDREWTAINLSSIGEVYREQGDYQRALQYFLKCRTIAQKAGFENLLAGVALNMGKVYETLGMLDSAGIYIQESYKLASRSRDDYLIGKIQYSLGELYSKTGKPHEAMTFYRLAMVSSENVEDYVVACDAGMGIANLYEAKGNEDSAISYARRSLAKARNAGFLPQELEASNFIVTYFKNKKIFDSAFAYMEGSFALKDSLISREKIREFQRISFSEQFRQMETERSRAQYKNKVKLLILLGGILGLMVVAVVLWRNVRLKHRANKLLTAQKLEIEKQRGKAEASYQELKATQKQLVQSEKMASLGELTAGIAHEIQNPLNFVNNFSEVNKELLMELNEEIEKGNFSEAKTIAENVIENEGKINHHGKRADSIVKGMLQHSRSSSGVKEPTDINALADEYLRLAYHGLRAKDKTFNVTMKTEFDPLIGKIDIIPQDIGRAILNLITNAFYAVHERKKLKGDGYEPEVFIGTKKTGANVEIRIKDNGGGIPQKVVDKIFQPFFTTKPTGQGTGLGLSLSYDIVKAHGGEIKVLPQGAQVKGGAGDDKDDPAADEAGAEFIILLPIK